MTWSCKIVRDALALGEDGQLARVVPGRRQHEGHRGVSGEIAHQVQVALVEWWLVDAAGERDDARDLIVGA